MYRGVDDALTQATHWLVQQRRPGSKRQIVVFDVDDTIVANGRPEVEVPEGVIMLQIASRLGYSVHLLTARGDSPMGRTMTIAHVFSKSGVVADPLHMRDPSMLDVPGFKCGARRRLVREGNEIVLAVGNEWYDTSDRPFPREDEFYFAVGRDVGCGAMASLKLPQTPQTPQTSGGGNDD